MKKHLLLILLAFLMLTLKLSAQQKVKDGTINGGNFTNKDAVLELESNNKGLLHVRVNLIETTNPLPLTTHVAGMMVYNTATSKDVVPGIYYNDGTKWVKNSKGDTGPQGPIGLTGPIGPQGTPGIKGDKGDTGAQGPIGLTGPAGPTGANGTNGLDGAKGDKGDTGAQGPIGLTGPAGPAGTNGINGLDGAKGDKGDTGTQGPIGLTGPAGPTGANGTNGLNGVKGDKGDTGAQGPIGLTGPAGPAGLNGANGSNGVKGDKGDTGAQGPIGLTGPAGPAGTNGINGLDGAKGDKGDTGTQGPIGLTGPAGPAGANGTNGLDGAKGDKGDTGTQGPIGLTGPAGSTGANGTNGLDGAKGDKGDTGAQGPAGADGQGGVSQAGTGISITGTGTAVNPYIFNNTIIDTDNQTITAFSFDNLTNVLTLVLERGNTKTVNLSALKSSASNGAVIDVTTGDVQLGGILIKPTSISTDATNTLAIKGLQSGTATDNLIVADNNGVLKNLPASTLLTEPLQIQGTSNKAVANNIPAYLNSNLAVGDFTNTTSGKNFEVKGDFKAEKTTFDNGSAGLEIGVNGSTQSITNIYAASSPLKLDGSTTVPDKYSMVALTPNNLSTSVWNRATNILSQEDMLPGSYVLNVANDLEKEASGIETNRGAVLLKATSNTTQPVNLNFNGYETGNVAEVRLGKLLANGGGYKEGFVRFQFKDNDLQTGSYDFPRNSGTANQVLVTDGNSENAQLSWADAATIAPEAWKVVGSGTPATLNTQNIYQMGAIGIGTTTPNSTLQVNGSLALPIKAVTADYTITADDYKILTRNASPVTITLPDPATCTGRTYMVQNLGASTVAFNYKIETGGGSVITVGSPTLTGGSSSGTYVSGYAITLQSDGTVWTGITQ